MSSQELPEFIAKKGTTRGSAIKIWEETINTIEFLLKATSEDGSIFENICTNLAIVILITGFESYCKSRFKEIENEGTKSNFESLINEFTPKEYRTLEQNSILKKSKENSITPTQQFVIEGKINFQDYESCKNAYKKAFNIKFFEDLNIKSEEIELIKNLIQYRHQVIHVSPLNTFPPLKKGNHLETKMLKNTYALQGMAVLNKFIHELHITTLNMKT
jgi:hypothetical protein